MQTKNDRAESKLKCVGPDDAARRNGNASMPAVDNS